MVDNTGDTTRPRVRWYFTEDVTDTWTRHYKYLSSTLPYLLYKEEDIFGLIEEDMFIELFTKC